MTKIYDLYIPHCSEAHIYKEVELITKRGKKYGGKLRYRCEHKETTK